jgi:excisionase family DNA binding protein
MKKVSSLQGKRKEKIVQAAGEFSSDVIEGGFDIEEGSPEEAELDRRLQEIRQKWQQHKESEGRIMGVEKLYTPEEVAAHLNFKEKTVMDYLRAGKIPGVKLGREWRVRDSDLQKYIEGLSRPSCVGMIRHRTDGTWSGKLTNFPDTRREPGEEAAEIITLFPIEGTRETKEEIQKELLDAFKRLQTEGIIKPREKMIFTTTGGGRSKRQSPL